MAKKTVTIYSDDLTGKEGEDAAPHTFGLDGISYEIDLGADSYEKLLDAVAPFTRVGRRVSRQRGSSGRRKGQPTTNTPAIREWAKENGYEINERGRVPGIVREAYEKATQS
ncbi:histone-like nucleoid-structuring protein Lsr2 [Streptomyces chartreusis]|uniref:histone-like nucleoid-structuring protein Lsr2 n=1 Tax=Streptomyces chartreusis TaxID=1969 RepID=UPI0036BABF17